MSSLLSNHWIAAYAATGMICATCDAIVKAAKHFTIKAEISARLKDL